MVLTQIFFISIRLYLPIYGMWSYIPNAKKVMQSIYICRRHEWFPGVRRIHQRISMLPLQDSCLMIVSTWHCLLSSPNVTIWKSQVSSISHHLTMLLPCFIGTWLRSYSSCCLMRIKDCANFVPSPADLSLLKDGASEGCSSDSAVSQHSSLEDSVPVSDVSSSEGPSVAPVPETAAVPAATPVVQHCSSLDGQVSSTSGGQQSRCSSHSGSQSVHPVSTAQESRSSPSGASASTPVEQIFLDRPRPRCGNSPIGFGHQSIQVRSRRSQGAITWWTHIFMWIILWVSTICLSIRQFLNLLDQPGLRISWGSLLREVLPHTLCSSEITGIHFSTLLPYTHAAAYTPSMLCYTILKSRNWH